MPKSSLKFQPGWGEPLPQRVVVLRALQLGDLLCAVPALRALRMALPDAEIVLLGLPWAKDFVERFDEYLDGFIEFPGYPGLPERSLQLRKVPGFLQTVQEQKFDLAIQMQGSGILTNPLIELLGARRQAGFYLPDTYCPDPELFLRYPENEPEVWRLLRLMEFLGIPLQGDDLEFPLNKEDHEALRRISGVEELKPDEYICIHPGARRLDRRWAPAQFGAVADSLSLHVQRIVLTGTAEEMELTRAVNASMKTPALNLAGRTSLGAMAALLNGARLLVCNDTGVSHLAAALGVPSVVIITTSDPHRWAPLDRHLHRVVAHSNGVTPHQVIQEARDLLLQERQIAPERRLSNYRSFAEAVQLL